MIVKGKSKKYQYLVDYALSILEKEKIDHENLAFKFTKQDPNGHALASFVRNHHHECVDDRPTIVFYLSEAKRMTVIGNKYNVAHEIGHYRDWLNKRLNVGNRFFLSMGEIANEKRANKFARKITKYKPSWLPKVYI